MVYEDDFSKAEKISRLRYYKFLFHSVFALILIFSGMRFFLFYSYFYLVVGLVCVIIGWAYWLNFGLFSYYRRGDVLI